MAPEAFVCPHCRTWVEGSGRSIRCPSCGKRFRADEARLERVHGNPAFESMDYEVPASTGWEPIEDIRPGPQAYETPATVQPTASTEVEAPGWDTPEPAYEPPERVPEPASHEWPTQSRTETPPPDPTPAGASGEESSQEVPWRWILSIAVLLLFFVGGRFLSGELFIVGFLALIAAQWFLERGKSES